MLNDEVLDKAGNDRDEFIRRTCIYSIQYNSCDSLKEDVFEMYRCFSTTVSDRVVVLGHISIGRTLFLEVALTDILDQSFEQNLMCTSSRLPKSNLIS